MAALWVKFYACICGCIFFQWLVSCKDEVQIIARNASMQPSSTDATREN